MIQQNFIHLTFQPGAKERGRKNASSFSPTSRHLQRGPGGCLRGRGRDVHRDLQRPGGEGEGEQQDPGTQGHVRPDQRARDGRVTFQTNGES